MPQSFSLTPDEQTQVRAALLDERPEVRRRAKALLLLHEGQTFDMVVQGVGIRSRSTLYEWIKRWRAKGVEGLVSNSRSGRHRKADDAHCELLEIIVAMEPMPFSGKRYWTAEALQRVMERNTSIRISDNCFRDLLHTLGYQFGRPKSARPTPLSESERLQALQHHGLHSAAPYRAWHKSN